MKLTALKIKNFLGVHAAEITLAAPVTLIVGRNGSGKSSVQEAVRMALTGESVRVGLKKDYGALVTDGVESGLVTVEWDGGEATVVLPSGKRHLESAAPLNAALPYVLDAPRFAGLDAQAKRAFLAALSGARLENVAIAQRLKEQGGDEKKVEAIAPFLRLGTDAAQKEAAARAREEKAVWRSLTGETYGEKKAAGWAAEKPAVDYDETAVADKEKHLAELDRAISEAAQKIGALRESQRRRAEAAERLKGLRDKAGRIERITAKLAHDEAELKTWEEKVERLNRLKTARSAMPCPECGVLLTLRGGRLESVPPAARGSGEDDDVSRLPEYEKARRLMQTSVANDQRDLAEAQAAAEAITYTEAALGEEAPDGEQEALETQRARQRQERGELAAELAGLKETAKKAGDAEAVTAKARTAHEAVLAWTAIAEALAPDGIPGQLLDEALGPVNDALDDMAAASWGLQAHIGPDMTVHAAWPDGRPRDYARLSESERWRVDAMIAAAIAQLSGVRLLVLDRFDVLDLPGRGELLEWLVEMAENDEIDSALIFGTLKALPRDLPPSAAAYWIENGTVAERA